MDKDKVSLKDYLLDCEKDEVTTCLMKLDASVMALHYNGFYVENFDANLVNVRDGEFELSSFENKLAYINKENSYGINQKDDLLKKNLLEMCAVGICAYNGFNNFYISKEFIGHLVNNFDSFCNNGKIPQQMVEYYQSVLLDGNIDYLNNFLYKKQNEQASPNQVLGNSNRLTKSTAIGRALTEKEDAYVNVLLLPSIGALIILMIMVIYFVFR